MGSRVGAGFQPLVLAKPAVCHLSGRPLEAGDDAYLGVREDGSPGIIVAPECVPVNMNRAATEYAEGDPS